MSDPKTLLALAGAERPPATPETATLVLIDIQNEYLDGPVAVAGAEAAVAAAAGLLAAARAAGAPVIHVAHKGRAGSLFDRDAPRGRIVDPLAPRAGEAVIEKGAPNAFLGTDLDARLRAEGREVLLCGMMTHMCVSSTARAATDLGFAVTVDAAACATRDLPDGRGGVLPAAAVHAAALAALADRFAMVRWPG